MIKLIEFTMTDDRKLAVNPMLVTAIKDQGDNGLTSIYFGDKVYSIKASYDDVFNKLDTSKLSADAQRQFFGVVK
jgi:hypothetical protein